MGGVAVGALVVGGIMALGAIIKGISGSSRAKRKQRREAAKRRKLTGELKSLEKSRQTVINPYDNVKNLSSLAKDLTGNLSNPYSNMGVATAAAEIQIEEADIALANTLDSLMASGASAGGATALAQAALQSKKGVSATIEKQEAANEKLKAQGQQTLEQLQNQEKQRVQGIEISEGQRVQGAEAQGKAFVYEAQEKREVSKINFTRKRLLNVGKRERAAYDQHTNAVGGMIGGVTQAATTIAGGIDPSATVSDRKLKENIKLIGKSFSGLNIYIFEYINKAFGEGIYQGVMSDEIPQEAVLKHIDGYDMVDYSKLDVVFKQI